MSDSWKILLTGFIFHTYEQALEDMKKITSYLEGKNINEILEWAIDEVDHFATYFFADNLNFFKRSGRVSNVTATMGNIIGFKPIIYMDDNGTMTNIGKERGRIKAINKLVEYVELLSVDIYNHRIIIGHTDALDLAQKLGNKLIVFSRRRKNGLIRYVFSIS